MPELDEEQRNKIIENNKKISELMEANEKVLRDAGYHPPQKNFAFDPKSERELRIQVPERYIRKKNYFLKAYGLMAICNQDKIRASNIAYELEALDFYDFALNRFGVYGPILSVLYKYTAINTVSVMETLVGTYIRTLSDKCENCPFQDTCGGRIKEENLVSEHDGFQKQIDQFYKLKIFDWTHEEYEEVKKIYQYRNHIHLSKAKDNELTSGLHTEDKRKKASNLLWKIDEEMKRQIVLFTADEQCIRYKKKKKKSPKVRMNAVMENTDGHKVSVTGEIDQKKLK